MTIYLAIDEYEDLESHFDLKGIYLSKKDMINDIDNIKRNRLSIYVADESRCKFNPHGYEKCNIKEFEKEIIEHNEYNEYLRLKAKFELHLIK